MSAARGVGVLHLVSARDGDEPIASCASAIDACGPRERHAVLCLGRPRDAQRAESLGVEVHATIPIPFGAPWLAGRRLRSVLARLSDARRGGLDVAQAWGMTAYAIGRAAFGVGPSGESRAAPGGLRAWTNAAPPENGRMFGAPAGRFLQGACMLAGDEDLRQAWLDAGALDVRVLASEPPPTRASDRDRVREALGLEPGERALGLLGDPPGAADLRAFAFVLGIVHATGRRAAGVAPAGCGNARRAERFIRLHGDRWRVVTVESSMFGVLPGLDAALVAPSRANDARSAALAARAAELGVALAATKGGLASDFVSRAPMGHIARSANTDHLAGAISRALDELDAEPRGARAVEARRASGAILPAFWAERP